MASLLRLALTLACVVGFLPRVASAQTTPAARQFSWGSTVSGLVGAARSSGETAATFGAGIGWEGNPRFELGAQAAWLNQRTDITGFAASLFGVWTMATGDRSRAVPFLKGGFGLYRASFDDPTTPLPSFYAGRDGSARRFTDPTFTAGGGLSVYLSRHISVRPVVEAVLIRRYSKSQVIPMATVQAVYHFEKHNVTP